ncbi:MAG: hypothetical protein HQ504_02070 [Rhodospirillaceae bacterium]|nr:hypothetical protein [Rhodospirillaceae bacterium]
MGGFETVAMAALQVASSHQQSKARQRAITANQQSQTQQIKQAQAIRERDQRDQLRRGLASRRARFGAQGLAANGGSAAALLNGLAEEAETSIRDRRGLDELRLGSIAGTSSQKRRANLLDYNMRTGIQGYGAIKDLAGKLRLLER